MTYPVSNTTSSGAASVASVYAPLSASSVPRDFPRGVKVGNSKAGGSTKTASSSSAQPTEKPKTDAETAADVVCKIVGSTNPGTADRNFINNTQALLGDESWDVGQRTNFGEYIRTWNQRKDNETTIALDASENAAMTSIAGHLRDNDLVSKDFESKVRDSCGPESSGGSRLTGPQVLVASLALGAAVAPFLRV